MTETTTAPVSDHQIREYQAHTLSVLDELLGLALPIARWEIYDMFGVELSGHIDSHDRPDADVRADLAAWAKLFRVDVVEQRQRRYTAASVNATYEGRAIKIWAHVETTSAPMEAEEAAAGRTVAEAIAAATPEAEG